jgi:DNA-binding PadR family transcriptional regulator
MQNLNDLEHVVLGLVWRGKACTPYEVRREFLDSPTPSWSGSAGTIYPLMRRLERLGLLASEDARRDRRGTRLYRATPAARRAVRDWLRPPLSPSSISPGIDPIRARLFFVPLLTPKQRARFFDVVERQLDEHVKAASAERGAARRGGDKLLELALRGLVYSSRARLVWFREVRAELA